MTMANFRIMAYVSALFGGLYLLGSGLYMQKTSSSDGGTPITRARTYNKGCESIDIGAVSTFLTLLLGVADTALTLRRQRKRREIESLDEVFE